MSQVYPVILADPPWSFLTYSKHRRTPTQKKFRGQAADHYDTMSLDEMKALPVCDWADKDCALIMWVVGSHLPDALALGAAWGKDEIEIIARREGVSVSYVEQIGKRFGK
jgi:N6-adenosine-specific RNA methylase IME4